MPGRKTIAIGGIVGLVLAGGLTALGAVVKHEPSFYHETQLRADEGRKEKAQKCFSDFTQMILNKNAKMANWECHLTQDQMNSFFAEIFNERGESETLRKIGISSPSVVLEDENHLRLAFRYDTGWLSTIVSYRLKIWLVPKEPNVIAVEFLSARAGALPISSQSILQQLCDVARKQDFKVNLYRHEGNSVAVIQLQPNENHPDWLLTGLQVNSNKLSIHGKTPDHALGAPVVKTPAAASH